MAVEICAMNVFLRPLFCFSPLVSLLLFQAGGLTQSPLPPALDPDLKEAIRLSAATPADKTDFVRLLDLGDTTVKADGRTFSVFRAAYRLNTSRARPLAEVNLPFNGSYEHLRVLKARTICKDGTIVEVKPEEIRATSAASEYLMYDDAEAVGFSMPAVEEGCIIDYTFEKTSEPKLLPGKFWTYWGFDGLAPVTLCRYRLTAPQSLKFDLKAYNAPGLVPTIKADPLKKTQTLVWEKHNLPRLQPEPAMPQSSEVRQWMEISNVGDWNVIAGWFWELAKPQLTPTPALKSLVRSLTHDAKTESEKAERLYRWICDHVRYVGIEFGVSAYRPHPVGEVYSKLYGDCKDKSALLVSMLAECGISAAPALLKADDHRDLDKGLPTLNAFNHCIVRAQVDHHPLWLDPTAETCAYGDIPPSDRGCRAMVVNNGKAEFSTIPLYGVEESGGSSEAEVTFDAEGNAQVEVTLTFQGELAQQMGGVFRSVPEEKRKEFAQNLVQGMAADTTLISFVLPEAKETRFPMKLLLKFSAASLGQTAGDLTLLPVQLNTESGTRLNPFPAEVRKYPIVNRENSRLTNRIRYHLPKGYGVQALPEPVSLNLGTQSFRLTSAQTGSVIEISDQTQSTAGILPPSDYPKVRAYYEALKKAARAKLVLKRQP